MVSCSTTRTTRPSRRASPRPAGTPWRCGGATWCGPRTAWTGDTCTRGPGDTTRVQVHPPRVGHAAEADEVHLQLQRHGGGGGAGAAVRQAVCAGEVTGSCHVPRAVPRWRYKRTTSAATRRTRSSRVWRRRRWPRGGWSSPWSTPTGARSPSAGSTATGPRQAKPPHEAV